MAEPENVQEFNLLVGAIFAQLYDTFPEEVVLDEGALGLACGLVVEPQENFGGFDEPLYNIHPFPSGKPFYGRFWSTLRWLRSEGFIYAETESATQNVVLTSKGLAVLKAKPSSLEPSFGEALKQETGKAAAEARNSIISNLVGQIISGAVKGIAGL